MTNTETFEALKAQTLALDLSRVEDYPEREPVRREALEILRDLNALVPTLPKGDPLIRRVVDLSMLIGGKVFLLPYPTTWKPVTMEDA